MRWGVRRYQNEDGSLTAAGKRRYVYGKVEKAVNTAKRIVRSGESEVDRQHREKREQEADQAGWMRKHKQSWEENGNPFTKKTDALQVKQTLKNLKENPRAKKAIKIGAVAAGGALTAYGAYKASEFLKSEAGKKAYNRGNAVARDLEIAGLMKFSSEAHRSSGGTLGMDMATDYMRTASKIRNDARQNARNISSSTAAAIKYLRKY